MHLDGPTIVVLSSPQRPNRRNYIRFGSKFGL
jgi:hypothetical protein